MSDEAVTFSMKLAGRDVLFRRPLLGQIIVLRRNAQRKMKQAEGEAGDAGQALTAALIKIMDFIETLIVSEQDKEFVEEAMLAGTVDWQDLLRALSGGQDDEPVADDEPAKPVKKAVKRSPKAAPKAIAAATRGHAKR